MGSNKVLGCQWPACPFLATSILRRGEAMSNLFLCVHHGNQFRAMTNAECADVARRRQPASVSRPGHEFVVHRAEEDYE